MIICGIQMKAENAKRKSLNGKAYKIKIPGLPEEREKRWSVQGVIITRRITVNISVCSFQKERPVRIAHILNGV